MIESVFGLWFPVFLILPELKLGENERVCKRFLNQSPKSKDLRPN